MTTSCNRPQRIFIGNPVTGPAVIEHNEDSRIIPKMACIVSGEWPITDHFDWSIRVLVAEMARLQRISSKHVQDAQKKTSRCQMAIDDLAEICNIAYDNGMGYRFRIPHMSEYDAELILEEYHKRMAGKEHDPRMEVIIKIMTVIISAHGDPWNDKTRELAERVISHVNAMMRPAKTSGAPDC